MSGDKLRLLDRSLDVSLWELLAGEDFTSVKAHLDKLESTIDYGRGETATFCVEYCGYDGGVDVRLEVYRDETDAEYAERMAQAAAAKEKSQLARERKKERARKVLLDTEAAERAEYERLRAKFDAA